MARPLITSSSNPLVKRVRALRQRRARLESGLFLVEGIHPVGEALEAGWDIESILYAPDVLSSPFGSRLVASYTSKLQPVTATVMQALADKENPQGLLAVLHQRHPAPSELRVFRYLVAMVAPQDPGNVGTVLRTMDAVGADALFLLDGGVDPYHPTCVRASMGALFWKPIFQMAFDEMAAWAKAQGVLLVGTSAHATADYRTLQPANPWILVLGTEQKGLQPEQLAACDVSVGLPMRGRASSLNVGVAAGVFLYQFCT